jgi:hypothetical protein
MSPQNTSAKHRADNTGSIIPRFKTINGLSIRYASCDAASGEPILLIGTAILAIFTS